MRLSRLVHGRDNNFNLIRICAAYAVLISHSFALSAGTSLADPLIGRLGMPMGVMAVDAFFVASGFLVTASLLARGSARSFLKARFLRVYPGLWVMLLLTVFGLGVVFTTLSLPSYLSSARIYFYLLKGATLVTGVSYDLPGVFEQLPYPRTVNGSLWTMPYEIRMYLLLLAAWAACRSLAAHRPRVFHALVLASTLLAGGIMIARHFLPVVQGNFARLFFMFFSGAGYFLLKEHVGLRRGAFWSILAVLLVAAQIHLDAFFVAYNLTIGYLVLYLAYVPGGFIRRYNRVGDYSYGVYIYAFPLQQAICSLVPGIAVSSLLVMSTMATLLFAALSWHLVEKPCLSMKDSATTRQAVPGRRGVAAS